MIISRFVKIRAQVAGKENRFRYGTGYAVTSRRVLTAGHVVRNTDHRRIELRFAGAGQWEPASVCWTSGNDLDACLLELSGNVDNFPDQNPLWGNYDRTVRLKWESLGFPEAAVIPLGKGRNLRTDSEVFGEVTRGGNETGLYELTVTGCPGDPKLWQGLSGAPVFAGGCLIGIIRYAPENFSGKRLLATPVSRLLDLEEFRELVGYPTPVPVPATRGGASPENFQLPEDRSKLPPVCKRLPDWNFIPYRSLHGRFINKVREMWEIHDILTHRKQAVVGGVGVVKGMGGIGKTQLAIEYAHRFAMCYPGGLFWIDTEQGRGSLIMQVKKGAPEIDIDENLEEDRRLYRLWQILGQAGPILLLLDNFPENLPLRNWLPPHGSIHVLVTTRRRDLDCAGVELPAMTGDEGLALLNSGDRRFGEDAKRLVRALGGLPLAIELARQYLNLDPHLSINDILEEIQQTGELEILSVFTGEYGDELPSGHDKDVAATIRMSWNKVSPMAQSVLQALSLLAPAPVPGRLLRGILNLPVEKKIGDPLNKAILEISRLSLADPDQENDPVMHRLISGFGRTTIGDDDPIYDNVVSAVRDEMARTGDDADTRSFRDLEKIVPHAEYLLGRNFVKNEQALDISNDLSWHHRKWGRYRLAETFGRKSLKIAVDTFDPGHPAIARSQSNLAMVLRDLGELEEARDLLRQALSSDLNSFGPGHPSIARSQSNLAEVLKDLGELEKARDLLEQAYRSLLEKFGPDHPLTRTVKNNLASVTAKMS